MDFANGVTVLFGRNGVGKTSLIHAIIKCLSIVFYDDLHNKSVEPISAGNPKLSVEGFDKNTDGLINPETGNVYKDVLIEAHSTFENQIFIWSHGVSSASYRYRPSLFKEAYNGMMNLIKNTQQYPVLAYYSDSFPHIEEGTNVSKIIASLRNFGYHQWNKETACSKIWLDRFTQTWHTMERSERMLQSGMLVTKEKIQNEMNRSRAEIEAIQQCLVTFSKGDPDMEVERLILEAFNDQPSVLTTSGKTYAFRLLPAGYKRLFYMILDLAYRSYILNGNTNAKGIVVIDEIDLHLHPTLEQSVLERLTKTFPHTQFIVSTHSPLVLTNLRADQGHNLIYRMNPIGSQPDLLADVYGLDYNTGLTDVMGVESRMASLENMITACAYQEFKKQEDEAERIKIDICERFGLTSDEVEKRVEDQLNAW